MHNLKTNLSLIGLFAQIFVTIRFLLTFKNESFILFLNRVFPSLNFYLCIFIFLLVSVTYYFGRIMRKIRNSGKLT